MEHNISEHIRSACLFHFVRAPDDHDLLHVHSNGQKALESGHQYDESAHRLLNSERSKQQEHGQEARRTSQGCQNAHQCCNHVCNLLLTNSYLKHSQVTS